MARSTIEATHSRFAEKISNVRLIFEHVKVLSNALDVQNVQYKHALAQKCLFINIISETFNEFEKAYNMSVIHVLSEYYNQESQTLAAALTTEYYKIVSSENFGSHLDEYLNKGKAAVMAMVRVYAGGETIDNTDPLYPLIEKILSQIEYTESIKIKEGITHEDYETCECGGRRASSPVSSELVCDECGQIKTLQGTATEEMHSQTQKVGRSKHGTYDPSRHFKIWMDRIQAKEIKEFPAADMEKIEYIIKRDRPLLASVAEMRQILKEAKMTKYNEHAPLLMKRFTGIAPTQLTFSKLRKFSVRFNRIMEILYEIRGADNNRPYYPYFIYKIIEREVDELREKGEESEAAELERLFRYIHLQSDDTIRKIDGLYKQVCELSGEGDGLKFKVTERRIYL